MTTKKVTIKKIKTKEDIITDKVDAIRNTLLGSYDDDGNYFISEQIVDELNRLTKLKKTVFNNSIFCVGNKLGYGEIVFEITFEKNTKEDVAIAKLFVLESVYKVNGYLQNTIKTQIEEFRSTIDNFINKSYDYYKVIIDPDEDEGREKKDITDEIFSDSFILAKKQYSLAMDKLTRDKYNDIYAKLFARRIEVLKKANNEYSNAVLNHFNEEFGLIEEHFLTDKNYKALNDLLDNSVEFLSGIDPVFEEQEREIEEELEQAYDEFEEEAEKIEDKFEFKAFSLLSKKDKEILKEIKKEETSQYKQVNKELGEQEIEVEVEAEAQTEEKVTTTPVVDENLVQLTAKNAEDQHIQKVEEPVQEKEEINLEKEETPERIVDEKLINSVKSHNELEAKEEAEVVEEMDEKSSDELQFADTDEKSDSLRDEIERITNDAHKEVAKDEVLKELDEKEIDEKVSDVDEKDTDDNTDTKDSDERISDDKVTDKEESDKEVSDDKTDEKEVVAKDTKSEVKSERETPSRTERVSVVKTFERPMAEKSEKVESVREETLDKEKMETVKDPVKEAIESKTGVGENPIVSIFEQRAAYREQVSEGSSTQGAPTEQVENSNLSGSKTSSEKVADAEVASEKPEVKGQIPKEEPSLKYNIIPEGLEFNNNEFIKKGDGTTFNEFNTDYNNLNPPKEELKENGHLNLEGEVEEQVSENEQETNEIDDPDFWAGEEAYQQQVNAYKDILESDFTAGE